MSDMDRYRYTLEEAQQEIARRECLEQGHRWEVVEHRTIGDPAGVPVAVVCQRCKKQHTVAS